MLSLIDILSAIILFQLFLLSLFLFVSGKGKRRSNILLASFFLLLALNLADGLLTLSGFYRNYPFFSHMEDGLVFLIGPLLFFYTRSLILKQDQFRLKDILHLIPFFVFTISLLIFFHFQSSQSQQQIEDSIFRQQLPASFYFIVFMIYLHVFTYLAFSFKEIRNYRHQIRNKFSDVANINLGWLSFLLGSVASLYICSLAWSLLSITPFRSWNSPALISLVGLIFVFINIIVWKALNQPQLFSGIEVVPKNEKYQAYPISDDERHSILLSLSDGMSNQKLFLTPDLTIDGLAEKLKISPRKLSQLINETYQQNFFDYINSFRIDEAQTIFKNSSDPKLTVLEVMYQVGFNSKSSFNTLFKKKTGCTPSEFKKRSQ